MEAVVRIESAPLKRLPNNGLEQTGSAADGLGGPCSSIQCWAEQVEGAWLIAVRTGSGPA